MVLRVLYCGDTQIDTIISSKGFDTFTHSYMRDSSHFVRNALAEGGGSFACDHMPTERVRHDFPCTAEALREAYDVVIVSDVGYDNFALPPGNRPPFAVPMGESRPKAIHDFVMGGGGLIMAGGWLSFSGLNGKGRYGGTIIEEVLPVTCLRGVDDRIEVSEGTAFTVNEPDHEVVRGLPWEEPHLLLGYNRVQCKPDATLVASFGADPALALWDCGKGRSVVYTTDPATHWGGSFLQWRGYGELWRRLVSWAGGR